MYISNNKYRLAELTEENLPESAKLLADTFITQNKVWSVIKPDKDEVRKFMVNKTKETLEWQNQLRQNGTIGKHTFLNFVYLDQNDKIVAVSTNIDLVQYFGKTSKVYFEQFEILQKYGLELQKTINPKDQVSGLSTYGTFISLGLDLMGSGLAMCFWIDISEYLHKQGYRVAYGRASSIKIYMLMMKYGGELTGLVKGVEGGKQITLSMLKWHFDPIIYIKHIAEKFTKKARL